MNQDIAKFSASVNIERDATQELRYITTPNAQEIFKQIAHNFDTTNQRAFIMVGAYGSGKSAFLWAFERTLNKKENYFSDLFNVFHKFDGFEFIRLVGKPQSLLATIAERFGVEKYKNATPIFEALDAHYQALQTQNKGMVIMLDEFGKFLEYIAKNSPDKELYFIQELAEWASGKNVLLIASLHQGFSGYSYSLTETQRGEWRKVEGRLKELTFNEPVEQLLHLASHHLEAQKAGKKAPANFNTLFEVIKNANKKIIKDNYTAKFAKTLYPFDILTATVLTQALQRYGQNERSLFSFLNADDYLGLFDFYKSDLPYFNLVRLYDYLKHNYHSFLSQKTNPELMHWVSLKNALERAEGDAVIEEAGLLNTTLEVLKTIGLLGIFVPKSSHLDSDFLTKYLEFSGKAQDVEEAIEKLVQQKIIRYAKHSHRYLLWEGSDIDIEKEIQKNIREFDQNIDLIRELLHDFDLPYIIAKQALLQRGTPRVFSFQLSEAPITSLEPEGEIDGYINLIFSLTQTEQAIAKASKDCKFATLFGFFTNTEKIRQTVLEIKAIRKVKQENPDDVVAIKELTSLEGYQFTLLNRHILENLEVKNENVVWFFKGERVEIQSIRQFNRQLSTIANDIYPDTPTYWNEMINTSEVSSQMILARKTLIKQIVNAYHLEDLGFEKTNFQPEKTVYLSLLQNTGIHRKEANGYTLGAPLDESFLPIWQAGEDFLESTKETKKSLQELVNTLLRKPYKLKRGLLDFWLPVFVFIKRNDFALYEDGSYKPDLMPDDFDVLVKMPERFEIKAFNVEGIKLEVFNSYRNLLNKIVTDNPDKESFIETIKPFLTFYKQLDTYAKKTTRLQKGSLALRKAIENATDPEKIFFEDIPNGLGFSLPTLRNDEEELENFTTQLQSAIRELRSCYDELMKRFEYVIAGKTGINTYPDYQEVLKIRFKAVRKHALLPHQEVFCQRVYSDMQDRKAWLSSLAHACLGKHLDSFTDHDELRLYDKFNAIVEELDNLSEITTEKDFDTEAENVFRLDYTSFAEGLRKRLIRLPKTRTAEMQKIEGLIKKILEKQTDKSLKIAILADLLQEELRNE